MRCYTEIDPAVRAAILEVVDRKIPSGCVSIWITGSRAKGTARPESDWDVVVIDPKAKPILPGHQGPIIIEKKKIFTGDDVEVVRIPPADWNHPGRFMTDCRQFGFRIR
jgi:predicted nucleotidyltransferase